MFSGYYSTFVTLRNGKIELVLVVTLCEYATYNAVRIVAMAGKGLKDAAQFLPELEAWALTQGAVQLEGWCRPSVSRLLRSVGFETPFAMCIRDLRRKLQ